MIPPVAAAVSFRYRGIGIVCGTQQGKTAALFNIGGEKIDNDAAPFLWIGPTKSNVQNVIVPQFDAMIEGCESLKSKMQSGRQKSLMKKIGGTTVRFAWAGSATEIASQPAHTVVVDEVDKCDPIPGHGNVLVQAEARISNYKHSGGILIATSSPTEGSVETTVDERTGLEHWALAKPEDLSSEMWKVWQGGTRHEFMAPCPSCGEFFAPRMKYLTGWEPGASPAKAKRAAKLLHWKCGTLIEEKHKEWMTANGRAVAPGQRIVAGEPVGEEPDTEWYTIWISGLFSPWVTWGDRAYQWIQAARSHDPETIRGVINLGFGELFRLKGEAPPWEDIRAISDDSTYDAGIVPKGGRKIFLTVDVQKDHLVVVIRAWGVEMESWLVSREEIWGDTAEQEVWRRLDELADKPVDGHTIEAYAIDSGYRTEQVYTWCERRLGRAYATKGMDKPSKLYHASDVEVLRNGKKIKRGLRRWIFDHGFFKGWVHDRIKWPQDQPGAWHLARAVGEDYCRQLVAEQRMRLASGTVQWVKTGTNDWLDAEALQALLAHIEGVRYLKPDDQQPPPPPPRGVRSGGVNI
jgi:phage terminase large subunit GpA-like protein